MTPYTIESSEANNLLDLSDEEPVLTKNDVVLVMASQLQPLPAILARLASLVSSGKAALSTVAEAISPDPVLTMKLLRSANSAFGSGAVHVSTVADALSRLGIGAVISMAFGVSVGKSMNAAVPAYGLAAGELWRHSAAAAVAAENLVRLAPQTIPPAAVTAALLHDVGKLIVTQGGASGEMAFICAVRQEMGLSPAEAEVMKMNHAVIGYIVTQHWGLPEEICRAIMFHHLPEQTKNPICDAVYLANLAAHGIVKLEDHCKAGPGPAAELIERLGLYRFDFEKFCVLCQQRFSQLRAIYGA